MTDILVAGWILFVAGGIGFLALPGTIWKEWAALRLAASFGAGLGLLILLVYVFGMLGLLHLAGKWLLLPLGTIPAALGWRRLIPHLRGLGEDISPGWTGTEKVVLAIILIQVLKNLLAALTPEVRSDCLDYHIQFPNLYAASGAIVPVRWHIMSHLPANIEMLFTLALLWGGDSAAKLIHFSLGLLSTLAVFGIGSRFFSRRIGLWAAFLFYIVPQVAMVSNACFNDLGRAAFETLAVAAWFELWQSRRQSAGRKWPWLYLTAVFTGLSLGVKWPSFPVFFAPLLLVHTWFLLRQRDSFRGKAGEQVLLLFAPLVLFAPWCLSNLVFMGNPFYPMLNSFFGLTDPVSIEAEQYFIGHAPGPGTYGFPRILFYWLERTQGIGHAGSVVFYLFLVSLFLVLVVRIVSRLSGRIATGGHLPMWGLLTDPRPENLLVPLAILATLGHLLFTYNTDGRFLLPVYPLMALLVAHLAGMLKSGAVNVILIAGLVGNTVVHQATRHIDLGEPVLPKIGRAREEYIKDLCRYRGAVCPLLPEVDRLPAGSLVLGVGFPARVPYILTVRVGHDVVLEEIGHSPYTGDELCRALRNLGVTHFYDPCTYPLDKTAYQEMKTSRAEMIAEGNGRRLYRLPFPPVVD